MKTIYVDLDCVLNNLVDVWLDELNELYHIRVKYDDITDYDITKFFPTLKEEEIFMPLYSDKFWLKTVPTQHSRKILKRIFEDKNNEIIIASSTHYFNAKIKSLWLKEYFPYIHWKNIYFIHDKSKLIGDILIDDWIDNLINFKGKRILYTQPWNIKYDNLVLQNLGIVRVDNWLEIDKLLNDRKKCNKSKFDFGCLECQYGYDDDGGIYCERENGGM